MPTPPNTTPPRIEETPILIRVYPFPDLSRQRVSVDGFCTGSRLRGRTVDLSAVRTVEAGDLPAVIAALQTIHAKLAAIPVRPARARDLAPAGA